MRVKVPKRHPQCECCDATNRAIENYRQALDKAMKKIFDLSNGKPISDEEKKTTVSFSEIDVTIKRRRESEFT